MNKFTLILLFFYINISAQITINGNNFTNLVDARNYVRTINNNMTSDIIVNISAGTYTLTETLEFTSEDSGTNNHNIIYQAADPNNKPIISGGQQITGWTLHDSSKNIWKANIGNLYSRQLYVNGERAIRARSEDNFGLVETTSGYLSTCTNFSNWENVKDMEIISNNQWKHFRIPIESICQSKININSDFWQEIHKGGGYFESASPLWLENNYKLIDNENEWYINKTNDSIYYKPFNGNNPNNLNIIIPKLEKLIISNKPNGVNISNYLQKSVSNITFKNLVFRYTTWNKPSTNNIYTNSNYGFITYQADAIIYDNYSTPEEVEQEILPSAISFYYGNNIKLINNEFRCLGSTALNFLEGSKNNTICSNVFEDISGSAIHVGDITNLGDPCLNPDIYNSDIFYDPTNPNGCRYPGSPNSHNYLTVDNNNIYNNLINQIGVEYFNSVGIFVSYARNTEVQQNTLSDFPYSGISMGWGWGKRFYHGDNNIISYNRIDCTNQILGDCGGIYTISSLGSDSLRCEISNNYILNHKHHLAAIYLDQESSNISVVNNLIDINVTMPEYVNCFPNAIIGNVRAIICYLDSENINVNNNFYNTIYSTSENGNTGISVTNCYSCNSDNNTELQSFQTTSTIIDNSGINNSTLNCN